MSERNLLSPGMKVINNRFYKVTDSTIYDYSKCYTNIEFHPLAIVIFKIFIFCILCFFIAFPFLSILWFLVSS